MDRSKLKLFKKNRCAVDTSKNAILYFCLRRTGSNAIANFIFNNYPAPKKFIGTYPDCLDSEERDDIKYIDSVREYCHGRNMELVLMRFENVFINKVDFKERFKIWSLFTGDCNNVLYALSLRDPFNTIASLMKHKKLNKCFRKRGEDGRKKLRRSLIIDKWKVYAREFLGDTNYLPDNKIFINYNKWVYDLDYRIGINDKMNSGKVFEDKDSNIITNGGGGSSFSGMNIINSLEMPLMERWKNYQNNEIYREIFKDKELHELSERIFGNIEGTEELL